MLEVKPLTSADHFIKPVQAMDAVGRENAHRVWIPAVVTISSTAAALSAAMLRQQAHDTKPDEDPKKSFKRKIKELLERLQSEA